MFVSKGWLGQTSCVVVGGTDWPDQVSILLLFLVMYCYLSTLGVLVLRYEYEPGLIRVSSMEVFLYTWE